VTPPPSRVALVVQRYGAEVNGGAEQLARRIARLLAADLDLTVLTTCALDYRTWANHYPPGEQDVDGVRTLRFPVARRRDVAAFDALSARAYAAPADEALGRRWMEAQGPDAPGLAAHLREDGGRYDAVAFVTYLYRTTADAIASVGDRAVLVPTLHDEPPARLAIFDAVFDAARALIFSTDEERDLARERFGVGDDRARVAGWGLDPPPPSDPSRMARLGVRRPYALCVGRIDLSKGVGELVAHHARYRRAVPDGLDLVLAGGGDAPLPEHPWLRRLGFVDESAKHDALAGAAVVVVPSPYESLSLVQLEAWGHGRPTLANAASPVLVGQSRRSGGGLWYRDRDEYAAMLDLLAGAPPLAQAVGRQGRRWVEATGSWDAVRAVWLDALALAASPRTATVAGGA
jgi:glycosyltransferase involved in cell wall biosynthesis